MLKLEKSRKNSEINIQLRQPRRLLDRYFLIALLFAIAVHLFAALIFHVRLFSFGQIETLLPTTRAQAHYIKSSTEDSDALVIAQANMQGRLTQAHLAPELSIPNLQSIPVPLIHRPIEMAVAKEPNIFKYGMEETGEKPFANLDIPLFQAPLAIHPSGLSEAFSLMELSPEESKWFTLKKFSEKTLKQSKLTYAIQIETSNGKVFWYELQGPAHNKKEAELAEKLLRKLVFQSNPHEFVKNGTIEFIFSSDNVSGEI